VAIITDSENNLFLINLSYIETKIQIINQAAVVTAGAAVVAAAFVGIL